MNLHPDVLEKAALLDSPRSLKDLYRLVGLIEEKVAVSNERQRLEHDARGECRGGVEPRDMPRAARRRQERPRTGSARCWSCGQDGHYQRGCHQVAHLPPGDDRVDKKCNEIQIIRHNS